MRSAGFTGSGLVASAQKLFLTLFCMWLIAADLRSPDSDGQLMSIGCWCSMDLNGKGTPLSQLSGKAFCAGCAKTVCERNSAAGNTRIRLSIGVPPQSWSDV